MQEFKTPDQNDAGTEPDPLYNKHTGCNSHKETTSKLTKLHKPDKTQSTTCISPKETRQNSWEKKPKKHHMDMTETIKLKIHGNGVKKKKRKKKK